MVRVGQTAPAALNALTKVRRLVCPPLLNEFLCDPILALLLWQPFSIPSGAAPIGCCLQYELRALGDGTSVLQFVGFRLTYAGTPCYHTNSLASAPEDDRLREHGRPKANVSPCFGPVLPMAYSSADPGGRGASNGVYRDRISRPPIFARPTSGRSFPPAYPAISRYP